MVRLLRAGHVVALALVLTLVVQVAAAAVEQQQPSVDGLGDDAPGTPAEVALAAGGPTYVDSLSGDTTWTVEGSPYIVRGRVQMGSTSTLTIEPGVVVKFAPDPDVPSSLGYLLVRNRLDVRGTPSAPIYFTSYRDDSVGGDTDGDLGAPQPGDWEALSINGAAASAVLENVVVRYGGRGITLHCSVPMIWVQNGADVTFRRAELTDSLNGIIREVGADALVVEDSVFARSTCGMHMEKAQLHGNVFESTLGRAIWVYFPEGTSEITGNYIAEDILLWSSENLARELLNVQQNYLLAPFGHLSGRPTDLTQNWWGRPLPSVASGCYDPNLVYVPPVTRRTDSQSGCASRQVITGYVYNVIPALDAPPALPRAGIGGRYAIVGDVAEGQTFGVPGAGSAYAYRPVGAQADPVNSATGSFFTGATDAVIASAGGPLVMARSYNSADDTAGPLGRGWSFTYQMALDIDANGATFHAGDGQRVRFTRNGGGGFDPPLGGTATLAATDSGYVLTTKGQVRHVFDAAGRLVALRDRNDQGVDLTYNAAGDLIEVSGSRSLHFEYDAGRLVRVVLPDDSDVEYGYDTAGRLVSVRDLRGNETAYAYNTAGRLTTVTDPAGHDVVQLEYDAGTGRVTDQWDARGNHSTFAWDADLQTATMTDARGGEWVDEYRGNVLVARRDPLGRTYRYEYDQHLQLTAVINPAGVRTTLGYDARGNVTSSATAGRQVTTSYNDRNDPVETTNARDTTVTFGYDDRGNLTSTVRPDPDSSGTLTTAFSYDARGLLTTATDAQDRTTSYDYNTAGDLTSVTGPDDSRSTFDHDALGRVTAAVDPRGNEPAADPDDFTTTFAYDPAGALTGQTDPLGNTSTVSYDERGLPTAATDPKGRTTTLAYDADGHLTTVTPPDPAIPASTNAYDASGNVVETTDAAGRTVTYTYDLANQIGAADGPLGEFEFGYDQVGNQTSITDPSGATTTLTYDGFNQLTGIDYPDATPDVTYNYDVNGNRTEMVDGAGTVTYAYDALDQLTSVTRGGQTFAYDYGPAGDLLGLTTPDGSAYAYGYDDAGRLADAGVDGDQFASYAYDAAGNPTSVTTGDGVVSDRTYDAAGRLTAITDHAGTDVISSYDYELDATGNPVTVTGTDGTYTYQYDTLDRLVRECEGDCTAGSDAINWTYDPVGNPLTVQRPAGTTTYTYDSAGRLDSVNGPDGTRDYTYDALSRVTDDGTREYTWNAAGRMTTLTQNSTTTTFGYDGDGRRLSADSPDGAVGFLWEPLSYQLVAETDDAGDPLRSYHLAGGGPIAIDDTSGRSFLHRDALGSVRATTDTTGQATGRYHYEPYGQLRGPPSQPSALGFTGQYQTPTGLYHLRHRDYDPTTGQFLSPDPAASGPTSAAYRYAAANPLVYTDPLGLWEAPGWVTTVNQIARGVEVIAGTAAIVCIYVCQPAVPILGFVAATGGVVTAATSVALAVQECTTPKGACGTAVTMAAIDTATGVGFSAITKGLSAGGRPLYRGDGRAVEEIFEKGMTARNPAMALDEHLAGGNGLIATSRRKFVATGFAVKHRGFVYVIDGVGGEVVRYPRRFRAFKPEREVIFRQIEPAQIRGAYTLNGEYIPNPGYGR